MLNIVPLREQLERLQRINAGNEHAMRQKIHELNTAKEVATAELILYRQAKLDIQDTLKLLDAVEAKALEHPAAADYCADCENGGYVYSRNGHASVCPCMKSPSGA